MDKGSLNRRLRALALALLLLAGLAASACGSDDDSDDDTGGTTTTETTAAPETTADSGAGDTAVGTFPSAEFCAAQADFAAAQDGAQRNTALGRMQAELGEDAPAEIGDAIDTLLTGDLPPEDYTAASDTLASACS